MSDPGSALSVLEAGGDFVRRHVGPDEAAIEGMLEALGAGSLDDLVAQAVPAAIVSGSRLRLDPPMSEPEVLARLRRLCARNEVFTSMIGMGYHGTELPEVIRRNVLEDPGWYTAYTPYQAEISQGRLELLLAFQQMTMDLTGMEVATASLLDEATAAAEAMAMSRRVSRSASNRFLVSGDCHPQVIGVVETRARSLGFEVAVAADPAAAGAALDCFGVLLPYPGSSGRIEDLRDLVERAHREGALVTITADPLALVLLIPPGELGADIVIGSAQRFGVPMGYGGPHAAFFATRDAYKRSAPGRIIGVSIDAHGEPALRMALQTREQHIRREKATSNICTAQVLLAVIAALYAVYHGPDGLRRIAERVHRLARILAAGLERMGRRVVHDAFFDTVTLHVPGAAQPLAARARAARINLRVIDADHLGIALDETTTRAALARLWAALAEDGAPALDVDELDRAVGENIPPGLRRTAPILTHSVFRRYHSESEMLRYLRRLAAKDLALDRAMIPLGSCTMKLNAATEMVPVTFEGFSALHPFVPREQAAGYHELFAELEAMLCECTGFDAVSLQPNAGSQGEYTGLLTVRRYHESRGEGHRDVCLIPASAHGTNPASATMAGLTVVVVGCDEAGNVDLEDLARRAEEHRDRLAALMVTYPSTHGVFEAGIVEICATVHAHGGQVYLDGANLNALLGIARLGEIGADVAHLNLHKTFCIPHGGGGPGMGPIGVRAHLAPFLPDHPVVSGVNPAAGEAPTVGPVSAAPWGSASILPISWAYIALMGGEGLRRATEVAILNANYVAHRLRAHYPVLYTGQHGLVAHECIIDLRPIRAATGITVDDVAKRLIDYGFHAPTVSFPVADTMMIEPTESESRYELDRFCDAMIAIREEVAAVESGRADHENNVLRNAPHSPHLLLGDGWSLPYRAEDAFFPRRSSPAEKYWPPVGRIDNVHGDRHLVCGWPADDD